MKCILLVLFSLFLFSCSPKKEVARTVTPEPTAVRSTPEPIVPSPRPQRQLNQSTPEATVEGLFKVAATGDFALLKNVCASDAAANVIKICQIINAPPAEQKAFMAEFYSAQLYGTTSINEAGTEAQVPFLNGEMTTIQQTMTLVKQGDAWYLKSY